MADQAQIPARPDELHRRLVNRRRRKHSAHLQVVRHDQVPVPNALAQNVRNPQLRKRRGSPIARDLRIRRMRDHYKRKLPSKRPVGKQILGPQRLQRLLNHRQLEQHLELLLPVPGGRRLPAGPERRHRQLQGFPGHDLPERQ